MFPGIGDVGNTIVFSVTAMSPSGCTTVKSNGKRIGRARLAYASPPPISGNLPSRSRRRSPPEPGRGRSPSSTATSGSSMRFDGFGLRSGGRRGCLEAFLPVAGDVGSTVRRPRARVMNTSGSKSEMLCLLTNVVSASSRRGAAL